MKKLFGILVFTILTVSTVSGVNISEGTTFSLVDINSNITTAKDFRFDNITVYGDKVRVETFNLSIYSNSSHALNSSLLEFNPKTSGGVVLNLNTSLVNKNKSNVTILLENLPSPSDIYKLTSKSKTANFSGNDITSSFELTNFSKIEIREESVSEDSGGGSSGGGGGGGSSGGSSGGGGGGLGGLLGGGSNDKDNDTEKEAKVEFTQDKIEMSMNVGERKEARVGLVNNGEKTAKGTIRAKLGEKLSFERDITVESDGETKVVTPEFAATRVGTFRGSIEFKYNNKSVKIPVEISAKRKKSKISIRSNVNKEDEKVKYSVDVSGVETEKEVRTVVYNESGQKVYSKTYKVSANSTEIEGSLRKDLKPGKYKFVSEIVSEGISDAQNFKVLRFKEEPNPLVGAALFVVVLVLGFFAWKGHKDKKHMKKKLDSGVNEAKENVISRDSEKGLNEIFEEKIEASSDETKELLENNLDEAKDILSKMEELDEIPEISEQKEKEIRRDIEDENFNKLDAHIDQLREVIDYEKDLEQSDSS